MKIAILDAYCTNPGDLTWAPIMELGDCTFYNRTRREEIVERARGHEIVLTNKVPFMADTLRSLPELKYIGVLATGTNVVDLAEAHARGIVVTNIPAYSTESVAQMVFALLLSLTNHAESYGIKNRAGMWTRSADFCYWEQPLIELHGKMMGIIGYGNIGSRVADIAHAFGMRVAVSTSKPSEILPPWMEKKSVDEIFASSDVVTLHVPLTPETSRMVNSERLGLMKREAILINTGRGGLVDEEALARALEEGRLYGAGLDVMNAEPPGDDNPLLRLENCITTPHIAWASKEARIRLIDIAASNLRGYLSGHPVNVV